MTITRRDTRGYLKDRTPATRLEEHFYDAITEHIGAYWDESHPTHNVLVIPNDTGEQRFVISLDVEEVDPRD